MNRSYTKDEIEYITHSRWTGLMTRETFDIELRYIVNFNELALVFWDIDELKSANNKYGKVVCSAKMRAGAREAGIELVANVWSGDEFCAIVPMQDALGLANRVQRGLKAEEMSATFVILEAFGAADVSQYLNEMDELINVIKQAGGRGTISDYREAV